MTMTVISTKKKKKLQNLYFISFQNIFKYITQYATNNYLVRDGIKMLKKIILYNMYNITIDFI